MQINTMHTILHRKMNSESLIDEREISRIHKKEDVYNIRYLLTCDVFPCLLFIAPISRVTEVN